MKQTSHAAKSPVAAITLTVLAAIVTVPLLLLAGLSALMSRAVLRTEPQRAPGVRVQAIAPKEGGGHLVTLAGGPEISAPGRYALIDASGGRWLVGEVSGRLGATVTRPAIGAPPPLEGVFRLSAYYYNTPAELGLPGTEVQIPTPLGPMPAWSIPAAESSTSWVIVVHGRGALRAEGLRSAPIWHANGYNALYVSYRNDPDAVPARDRRYGLGTTEWRDVDAAIAVAVAQGAERIMLMGWSMGGAIAFQTLLRSAHRDRIVGLVLDSPVISWADVLRHQATLNRMPSVIGSLSSRRLRPRRNGHGGIPDLASTDMLIRAEEISVPVLILHSTDDGFVPAEPSVRLAALRPELVTTHLFANAIHTRIWNDQPERWQRIIDDWLHSREAQAPNE